MNQNPKAYQQGWIEFYKLRFKVTPDVLIPRPETELLVDEVLKFVAQLRTKNHKPITILDIGTGTGNIAISLACNPEGCHVNILALDISPKALKTAQENAKLHRVEDKIIFIQSDLLSAFIGTKTLRNNIYSNTSKYRSNPLFGIPDIVVTNLPYIPSARIPYLDSSVKDFEPHMALDGGEDGFKLYRKLFQQIKEKNWQPKLIIGEIDYTHGELAALEAQKYFPKAEIEVKKDLAHLQRILLIR